MQNKKMSHSIFLTKIFIRNHHFVLDSVLVSRLILSSQYNAKINRKNVCNNASKGLDRRTKSKIVAKTRYRVVKRLLLRYGANNPHEKRFGDLNLPSGFKKKNHENFPYLDNASNVETFYSG